jgi:hypothetical protein
MGGWTDANIAAWQEAAGIKPARGERAEALEDLSQAAFQIIKIVELERSGIRDGDGYWHGCAVLHAVVDDVAAAFQRWAKADPARAPTDEGETQPGA